MKENALERQAALAAIAKLQGNDSSNKREALEIKEDEEDQLLVICIRPTFEGKPAKEDCRFIPIVSTMMDGEEVTSLSEKSRGVSNSSSGNDLSVIATSKKKRPYQDDKESSSNQSLPKKHASSLYY
jgi:hypothetical protein